MADSNQKAPIVETCQDMSQDGLQPMIETTANDSPMLHRVALLEFPSDDIQ